MITTLNDNMNKLQSMTVNMVNANLAKYFLKPELNLNLSIISPKPLTSLFSPQCSIDRVL